VQIGWMELLEFRNYRILRYDPSPRLNVLAGPNAQGKSNLLEALAFLLTGRSFRTAHLGELPRWGQTATAITGELRRSEGSRTIRRAVRQGEDSTWRAQGGPCPWARAIVFGWQDLAILTGAPAARRNFIDGVAARLYASHLASLVRFRGVVARRNHLLRARPTDQQLGERLAPWDEQLAELGAELLGRRRRAVAMLQTELARIYPALSGERHKVEIRYRTALGETTEPRVIVEALMRARREEIRRGQTLVGPHRDDLAMEIDGVDARVFGSRGQQRLLALALRLAEVLPVREAVGTAPVLLLDDALSELDVRTREHVLHEVQTADQVFLTTPEPLALPGAACWDVRGGGVVAA
jgi:DNA replication and repair protein RecF